MMIGMVGTGDVDMHNVHVDVLNRQKVIISVQRGKKTVTKVEHIPPHFDLHKMLKELKSKEMLSIGVAGILRNITKLKTNLWCFKGHFPTRLRRF